MAVDVAGGSGDGDAGVDAATAGYGAALAGGQVVGDAATAGGAATADDAATAGGAATAGAAPSSPGSATASGAPNLFGAAGDSLPGATEDALDALAPLASPLLPLTARFGGGGLGGSPRGAHVASPGLSPGAARGERVVGSAGGSAGMGRGEHVVGSAGGSVRADFSPRIAGRGLNLETR
jgi:hypothetical protein